MATGTLYTYPDNFRANKALIAAQYSGAKVKVVSDPPEFKFGETNKTDAFLKKFPLGKVPAFEGSNGVKLFESNAIAYYVANEALRGSNPADAAFVMQWVNFADNEILPAACTWVFPCMGIMQYNKQNTERAKEDIKNALAVLNSHLEARTFLVGERASLADIGVTCNLMLLYKWVLEPSFRQAYQNVNRWFTTMVNQPQVKDVIGDFTLCEKMAQFDAKKFQELQGGSKKAPKKPQEKKQPAKKPAKEEEEADEAPKEKAKDPFAVMPTGDWDMDEWKRTYSNAKDTIKDAMPYFWKKFEKQNYSIWKAQYKYDDELDLTFMSMNLIGGMFQRLDRMRKHSFGSMILFGEDKNSSLSGMWMWKGQDLAFELSTDLMVDYESYTWTKCDPESPETRKMVEDYFDARDDLVVNGKKLYDCKIWK